MFGVIAAIVWGFFLIISGSFAADLFKHMQQYINSTYIGVNHFNWGLRLII